jgi:adenylate cyclase
VQPSRTEPFEVPIGNTATIGRTRENTVCLSFSPQVSRQHAVVRCHNGWQFQLIDLGSRNGTYVNDKRVVMPVTLENSDRIRIADTLIVFAEDQEGAGPGAEQNEATMVGSVAASIAEARPVALLVCDIRGFSTMSEKVASNDLAQLVGAWFRDAGNVVHESTGTIDKFIGDAVLAYWGAAQSGPDDCRAAFESARKLHTLAAEHRWPNGDPFRIAIALHYGRVTCSNVGLAAARDATIIGDAVNTVFRLEAVSKEVGQSIVLSHPFAVHLPESTPLKDFGERALKGKKQQVRVFGYAT